MKGTFINISSEKKTMSVIYGYWQRHLLYSTLTYLTGKNELMTYVLLPKEKNKTFMLTVQNWIE